MKTLGQIDVEDLMHERKKGGERKDKKNKRMHEASDLKHELHEAKTVKPSTDEVDVVNYKPGSGSDANRRHIQPNPKSQPAH